MNKTKIKSIKAREILDSRGNPTLEVECETDLGRFVSSVPSGASKGIKEAIELRDGDRRYGGKGVLKAVKNVNDIIAPKLRGGNCFRQREIDDLMIGLDNTRNKAKLGANAIVGVSMAVCKAGATSQGLELYEHIADLHDPKKRILSIPRPCFNVINGGAHAGNNLNFQEFMIVPKADHFFEKMRMASEVYYMLKKLIKEKYGSLAINIGDEGGFAPPINIPEIALGLITQAIEKSDYKDSIDIIIDVAASQFYVEDGFESYYALSTGGLSKEELLEYYLELIDKYPIIGIEDPFQENDFESFSQLKEKTERKIMVVGDDLTVSNKEFINQARRKDACNALILKINQIGTVTEIIDSARLAKDYNFETIVSHRSGDTIDDFIADLAVGINADYIKSGAPARGERLSKYNRLSKIEERIINN